MDVGLYTRPGDPGNDVDWHEDIEGESIGSPVSLIIEYRRSVGTGPRLHRHPYAETFVVRQGHVRFTVADETIEAHGGQVVVVPPNTPHKFVSLGPEPMISTHIHANPVFVTEWLE